MIKDEFKNRYSSCVVEEESKHYKLGNLKNNITFNVDKVFFTKNSSGDKCDEFVFFDLNQRTTGIYLIEIKENMGKNVKKVKDQLQGGANLISDFLNNDPALDDSPYEFSPVLVSHGVLASARPQLTDLTVILGNKTRRISHVKKGSQLPKINT